MNLSLQLIPFSDSATRKMISGNPSNASVLFLEKYEDPTNFVEGMLYSLRVVQILPDKKFISACKSNLSI